MRRKQTYIHDRPGWPDLDWDGEALASALAAVRHAQGRLLGRMEALGFEPRAEATLVVLTGEIVDSSAIEAVRLNPAEVRSSIAKKLGLDAAGLPKASRDVEGIVALTLDATRNFQAKLTRQRLFGWHQSLFPQTREGMRPIRVGAWRRAGPMQVVSGPLGRERVHFEAPDASRMEVEMRQFLRWFNAPSPIDPVLKAGVAHFWFVTIHPFEDGNGRLARAIADLLLARADGTSDRFYSMSSQIAAERDEYYRALERAQRGDLDITRWLEWFLACLGRAIAGAGQTLGAILHQATLWQRINRRPVNDRQRRVINRLLEGFQGYLSTSRYAKLAKCSTDTALRDIHELVERGILARNPAGGRSTSYRLADLDAIQP